MREAAPHAGYVCEARELEFSHLWDLHIVEPRTIDYFFLL
jgi:hypothetical protein